MKTSAVIGLTASLFFSAFQISPASAQAQKEDQEGPLGLTWGISANQVRALGVDLKDGPRSDFGVSYVATNLPRALSDQEMAIVSFGYDDKLWRIGAISRPFPNDPAGTNVKSRYQELLGVLIEKYGRPAIVHSLGDSIYREARYFLAGINGGHTSWYSNFDTAKLFIQLGILADDSSAGRWRIIFEEKALRKTFESGRRSREKGAL
jgi:hypothetical protein